MSSYKTASAFRSALEERLRRRARHAGVNPQRFWSIVAFDRVLARLLGGQTPLFVLKGGYAMELRTKNARATKDVDLTVRHTRALKARTRGEVNERLLEELQRLAAQDLGDFFKFTVGRPTMDLAAAPYGGARFPTAATLDGRVFAEFHLDVGVGDPVSGELEEILGEDWLGFAGLPRPRFAMISREQQFAEKVHAYTRPRTGRPNSRTKDLIDMVLLIELGGMARETLREALRMTFSRRDTHPLPAVLLDPPPGWEKPFAALARSCGSTHDPASAIALVRSFLAESG